MADFLSTETNVENMDYILYDETNHLSEFDEHLRTFLPAWTLGARNFEPPEALILPAE